MNNVPDEIRAKPAINYAHNIFFNILQKTIITTKPYLNKLTRIAATVEFHKFLRSQL